LLLQCLAETDAPSVKEQAFAVRLARRFQIGFGLLD
jgi:hypothetical protein